MKFQTTSVGLAIHAAEGGIILRNKLKVRLVARAAPLHGLGVAILLGAALAAAPASASDLEAAASGALAVRPEPGAQSNQLEEVIVTAERRETSLQETAAAVSSFQAQSIEKFGTTDTRSLMGLVPNLYVGRVATAPSTQTYGMRGLAQTDTIADPTVAVYVDDIYLPRSLGAMMDMPDLQRIEVLRGPQGTLYGRNATGGAIKFITRDPTADFTGNLSVGVGDIGQWQASGYVAGAIYQDKVLGSFTFLHKQTDGYTEAPNIGRKVNRIDQSLARGKLVLRPSDDLTIKLSADGFFDKSDATVYTSLVPPAGGHFDPYLSYEKLGYNLAGGSPAIDLNEGGASVDVAYRISPELTFKSISAYRGFEGSYPNGDDGLPTVNVESFAVYREREQSQELQLLGAYNRLSFTAGFYYFDEDFRTNTLSLSNYSIGAIPSRAVVDQNTESFSAYFQAEYKLARNLTATVGARYTYETRDFSVENNKAPGPSFVNGALNYNLEHAVNTYSAFSPKVGLQYQLTPSVMAYATYSEGFQAGGFSFRAASAQVAQKPFAPEYVRTAEAGVRTELFDNRARVNFTIFNNDISDLQLTAYSPALLTSTIQNAGAAYTRGAELETSARILGDLTLTANASYLDSRYTRFSNPSGPGTSGVGLNLVFAPTWVAGATLSYAVPVRVPGEISVSADYRFQSKTYTSVSNTLGTISPGQSFTNASIQYRTPDKDWIFSAAVKNVFDGAYKQFFFVIPSQSTNAASFNAPRTFLISAKRVF